MDRRTLLRWTGGLVVAGLAGCTGGTDTGDGGTPSPTPPPETPTPTSSPTPSPTPAPTETETPVATAEPTETASPTPTPEPTPEAAQVVEVAPDGEFAFRPEEFTIAAGETVRWVWRAGGHNVKVESSPSDADWSGTPGGEFDTFGEGHTYSYTFEVAGRYEYFCAPHKSLGMAGGFTVE